jgi:hypothetical protein
MNQNILYTIAVLLGAIHVIFRPNYYNTFITLSKEKNWSFNKTLKAALVSSFGHVLGSIVLSFVGLAPAILVGRLRYFSPVKGTILVWFLILFGLLLIVYGIRQAYQSRPHKHLQLFPDGTYHTHTHVHKKESTLMKRIFGKKELTLWSLFISFFLAPFEGLVVLQVWPAFYSHIMMIVIVTLVFSIVTIVTMLFMTYLMLRGFRLVRFRRIGVFSYLIIGIMVLFYGVALMIL